MSYSNGARKAGRDIAKGKFIRLDRSPNRTSGFAILASELPANYKAQDFEKLLKRKYGITQRYNNKVDFHYMLAYNSIMTAALREKYGEDFYEKAQREAYPGVKTFYRMR